MRESLGETGRSTARQEGTDPLLSIDGLKTHYPIRTGWLQREVGRVRAVDGVSFDIQAGEAVGLVGESGSGKSTVARSVVGLEEPTEGEIRFEGTPVHKLSNEQLQSFRRRVQLIVQDPNEAFNPRMTVGEAVAEPLRLHGMDDADRRRRIVADLLERVGLSPEDAERYPHAFSGGEKQRIAIARALVVNPDVMIADEPISALDSRVQSDILALLDEIRREFDIAVLFISHDIDVVRLFCERLLVMYLGEVVERGPIDAVLDEPAHPYTRVLVASVPSLDPRDRSLGRPLTDTIPDPSDPPDGCRFHTRCPEIIPPRDVDLPPDDWRAIARFRFELQAGELPEDLVGSDSVTATEVRDRLNLPSQIRDEKVETHVEKAIEDLLAGELTAAADRMASEITTICERSTPSGTANDRPVACHRYDADVAAEPTPWSP